MFISKDWKVEADEVQYVVSHREVAKTGKNAGVETWDAEAYFYNLHEVLKWFINNEIKGTGLKDLKTVCDKIAELEKLIPAVS